MSTPRFDGRSVLITDGTTDIGRRCATSFLSLGADVLVNVPSDLSMSAPVESLISDTKEAIPGAHVISESRGDGYGIVKAIVAHFGGLWIVIDNASAATHIDPRQLDNVDAWNLMMSFDLKGAFNTAQAAFSIFRQQSFGRIIFLDQGNLNTGPIDSVAKYALFGLAQTICKEGAKYNIKAHRLAFNASLSSVELGQTMESVIALASHESTSLGNHILIETDGQDVREDSWERSRGLTINPDQNFTPSTLLPHWSKIHSFSKAGRPDSPADFSEILPHALSLPVNTAQGNPVSLAGKVVVVTGAASGLGRCYALEYAKHGAFVVVNDLKSPTEVVDQITRSGGSAVGCQTSAENGEIIVKRAIDEYGRVDVVVNNAGGLRDKSILKLTEDQWDFVLNINLGAAYAVTKAAWPYMIKQRYGRIINITSTSGIYGNFGQANYSTAKLGIFGLSQSLAEAGRAFNINVNTVAPVASTELFLQSMPATGDKNAQPNFKPEYVAPLIVLLGSDALPKNMRTGNLYEVGAGWHACTRLRSVSDSTISSQLQLDGNIPVKYTYSDRDIILFNLCAGAKRTELPLVYEKAKDFGPLPTFGTIPFLSPAAIYRNANLVPNFDPSRVLLGEQYLEVLNPNIPTSGTIITTSKVLEVLDKGNAAVSITGYTSRDVVTGIDLYYNEASFFLGGSGGFGGSRSRKTRGPSTRSYTTPPINHNGIYAQPDAVAEFKTSEEQAAMYRLLGDRQELHIDPEASNKAGYSNPILHGQCSMIIASLHVYRQSGTFRSIKVRFMSVVIPGQTLRTEMWKDETERDLIVFQVKVVENGKTCISGGVRLTNEHTSPAKL